MFANDSVLNLRLGRKRSLSPYEPDSPPQSKRRLPIDELRAHVAAKRLLLHPDEGLYRSIGKGVQFDLEKNKVHEIFDSKEDLQRAWMSFEESDKVRRTNLDSIAAYRRGAMDHENDCLRGLEWHATPELMKKKIENGRNYAMVILEQQCFLRNMMGRANEVILSRMSILLSNEDKQDALHSAMLDAQEATRIHEVPVPLKGSEEPSPSSQQDEMDDLSLQAILMCTSQEASTDVSEVDEKSLLAPSNSVNS